MDDEYEEQQKKEAEAERRRGAEIAADWAKKDKMQREVDAEYNRKRYNSIKGDTPSNTGHRGINYSGGDYYSENFNEGIFGGNKYKGKDILVYRGNGEDEPIAYGSDEAGNYNLIYFKQAHAKKNGNKESDYTHVAATDMAVKKYKKALKSIPDVSSNLPGWVNQYIKDAKAQRSQEFDNEQRRKEREAEAKRYNSRRAKNDSDDDDGRVYVQGKGFGTYKYREELEEGAFSGGYAGDNSFGGGKIRGIGASTQNQSGTYLRRLKSKNPEDLVSTMTIKTKDIKPGMITADGQVKEVEFEKNRNKGKMYIMHTNNWDGYFDADGEMEVLADPENKSQPFTGEYRSLLKMGLKEAIEDLSMTANDTHVEIGEDENGKEVFALVLVVFQISPNNTQKVPVPGRRAGQ